MSALALLPAAIDDEPEPDSKPARERSPFESDRLSVRITVAELVDIYSRCERDILVGFALIAHAEKVLNDSFTLDGTTRGLSIRQDRHGWVRWSEPESAIRQLKRDVWGHIVDRLEVRRFSSIAAWDKLQKEITEGEPPDVTTENVAALARQFSDTMPEMLRAAVTETYEWLRPHRSNHATNQRYEIGPKVILTYAVEACFTRTGYRVCYHSEQHLTALENVFNSLDGKGSVTKGHYSQLSQAIKDAGPAGVGETDLFAFKCYGGTKTLHLKFLRLDLLKRFNMIAGGKRLRGEPRGSR